jgi:hypothetical protein
MVRVNLESGQIDELSKLPTTIARSQFSDPCEFVEQNPDVAALSQLRSIAAPGSPRSNQIGATLFFEGLRDQ